MNKSSIRNLEIERRALDSGNYIIQKNSTVRRTAKAFGVSKSTTYKDLTKRLLEINPSMYLQVQEVIINNIEERAVRGGQATKIKYLKK